MLNPQESSPNVSATSWDAEVRETHSGLVLLTGDRAYKVKKPVNLGFLDFTSCSARRAAIHRELALNRRLTPDVYLGVAEVVDDTGQPCEYLLVMRRMPDARRLSTLLAQGEDVRGDLRWLARDLAAFHALAPTGPGIDACGGSRALRGRWEDNVAGLRALSPRRISPDQLHELEVLALDYVTGCAPLLQARIDAGLIRDGHGDLLADDIFCLPDGPRVLDCLDFDEALRYMDVLDDVACLAMDLERLGRVDLAEAFLKWYSEFSGTTSPASLKHQYIAYRAVMRAKVTALRERAEGSDQAADEVAELCAIGRAHLKAGRRRLILIGGAPASGKTTLATALADRVRAPILSSDRTRKESAGISPQTPAGAGFGEGLYTTDLTDRTYALLRSRAETLLGLGESVIVDASFTQARHREPFRALAATARADLVELRCMVSPPVARQRWRRRAAHPDRYTDADEHIAERLAAAAEPWPQAHPIDTSTGEAALTALTVLRQEGQTAWRTTPR